MIILVELNRRKKSVIGVIKNYHSEEKVKPTVKKEVSKKLRDKYLVSVILDYTDF